MSLVDKVLLEHWVIKVPREAIIWYENGARGLSSEAMFIRLILGLEKPTVNGSCYSMASTYPRDAKDFRLCYGLFRRCGNISN